MHHAVLQDGPDFTTTLFSHRSDYWDETNGKVTFGVLIKGNILISGVSLKRGSTVLICGYFFKILGGGEETSEFGRETSPCPPPHHNVKHTPDETLVCRMEKFRQLV
jgi:hypothetical protein